MTAGHRPTQVERPWRATVRTAVQTVIGFAALVPVLVELGVLPVSSVPWLGGVVVAAATITRVMGDPRVERFLDERVPWLAAEPTATRRGRHARRDRRDGDG